MFSLAAGRTSRSWRWVARPCAALRLRRWETPVDDHDGDPLRPRLPALLGDAVSQSAIEVRCPSVEPEDPCCPRFTDIFPPPIRIWRQHRDLLPPQGCLPCERLPLLLPGRIGIKREDQCLDRAGPSPSASPARHRSPPHVAHPRPAAPAHQRRPRTPTADRRLPATRWR